MTVSLERRYDQRYREVLVPTAVGLETLLKRHFSEMIRVDRIGVRAKRPERFLAKAVELVEGKAKYSAPLAQVQDQIGARVTVLYLRDVHTAGQVAEKYYHQYERRSVVPDRESEFGYFGLHYIMDLPHDAIPADIDPAEAPEYFELQIKTLWQHAWSEANHDLGYKPSGPLSPDQRRRLAFTSAQAWGADRIFDELFGETLPTE